jgi:hypothetical protein
MNEFAHIFTRCSLRLQKLSLVIACLVGFSFVQSCCHVSGLAQHWELNSINTYPYMRIAIMMSCGTLMYRQHYHEYHHAMPLGQMMCVYCGELRDTRTNLFVRNHSVSKAKTWAISKQWSLLASLWVQWCGNRICGSKRSREMKTWHASLSR